MIVMVIIVITMIATCYGDEDDKSYNEISLHLKCSSQLVSNHLVVPIGKHVLGEPDNEDDNFYDEKL